MVNREYKVQSIKKKKKATNTTTTNKHRNATCLGGHQKGQENLTQPSGKYLPISPFNRLVCETLSHICLSKEERKIWSKTESLDLSPFSTSSFKDKISHTQTPRTKAGCAFFQEQLG